MQCNKMLIKVLKLFLIFQFSTKDYIAKTQVYTSVFETFTQYCNNHSVQLVTSMHSDHLPLVMTAIVPDSAGCRSMLVHGWCSWRRRLTAEQILHTAIQYIDALRLTWGVDCRYLASKKNNTSSFLHSGWASRSACSLLANPVKTWSGYQPIFSNNSSLCSMLRPVWCPSCTRRNAAVHKTNSKPTLPLRLAVEWQAHLHATSGILKNCAASKIQLTINIRLIWPQLSVMKKIWK